MMRFEKKFLPRIFIGLSLASLLIAGILITGNNARTAETASFKTDLQRIISANSLGVKNVSDKDLSKPAPFSETLELLKSHIQNAGADQAYKDFSEVIRAIPGNDQHYLAHFFGQALFEEAGIRGTSVCDDKFTMGCWHAFFGEAISKQGVQITQEAAKMCNSLDNSHDQSHCGHGLGHGVVSNFGYDADLLTQALSVCRSITSAVVGDGCVNGSFMEFNERTSLGFNATLREADSAHPYDPCEGLSENDQAICFFWQPHWWQKALFEKGTDLEIVFHKIGELCGGAEQSDIHSCFQGTGYAAAWAAHFETYKAGHLCSYASNDSRLGLICRTQAALTVAMNSGTTTAARICDELMGQDKITCAAWARRDERVLNGVDVSVVSTE